MNSSLFFRSLAIFLFPVFSMMALFLFFRGHHLPGGGFIAGLMAAAAFVVLALAFDVKAAQKALFFQPVQIIGFGLFAALSSGFLAFFQGEQFFTAQWIYAYVPLLGKVHVGTPLIFDLGVFLVVIGISVKIVWSLLEEREF